MRETGSPEVPLSGKVSQTTKYRMNSSAAMLTQEKAVRIAGQNCTAPAAVQQMHTMQQAASQVSMNMAVICSKNVSNVRS